MNIVILGGGGFIGSTVVDRLLLNGHNLRVFERPRVAPYRKFKESEHVDWMTGDLSNTHDISNAIRDVDIVLHLISTTLPKGSNDDPIYDVKSNVVGTIKVLNAMVTHHVQKIVFISSGGTVYGSPIYLPIDEKHPTNPLVSYGITKLAIEKYLQLYSHLYGIKAITLRVANPYGERQRIETAQGAVGVFLYQGLLDIPIEIWGDGSITRDYIHVSDVAEAFIRAVEYSGEEFCFNISSGTGTNLNELISMIENVIGKSIEVRYKTGRVFDVPISVLSNDLARKSLQWTPLVSMKDGLSLTAEWMKTELTRLHPEMVN